MEETTVNMDHIWREYRSDLRAFLQSRVSNPADVDDLLQDLLLKSHQNLHTVKAAASLKSWLFQIARNTIIDYYRHQKKARSIGPDDLWYDDTDPDIRHALEKCVAPFIAALPELQRTLLTAIDLERQPQKEYAARHGLAYSTLKSRVKKAREAMRKLFEDCCHLSLDAQGNIIEYQVKPGSCDTDC